MALTCPDCGGAWRPIYGAFRHEPNCPRLKAREARSDIRAVERLRASHSAEDARTGVVGTKVLRDPYRDADGRDITTPEEGE